MLKFDKSAINVNLIFKQLSKLNWWNVCLNASCSKNENIIIKTFIYIKWTDKNKSYTNKGKCKQSSTYFYAWLCRKIVKSRFGCCHSVRFFDHRLNFNPGLKWWSIIFAQTQTVILRPKTLYNHDDKGTLKKCSFCMVSG